jgi:hypothetical protein
LSDGENLILRDVDAPNAIAMNNAAAGAVAVFKSSIIRLPLFSSDFVFNGARGISGIGAP